MHTVFATNLKNCKGLFMELLLTSQRLGYHLTIEIMKFYPRAIQLFGKTETQEGAASSWRLMMSFLVSCLTPHVILKESLLRLTIPIPVVISVIYAAPQLSVNYFNSRRDHLSNLISTCLPIIVVGDFNLPDIHWTTLSGSSTISNQLCERVFELSLIQLIDQPTHICTWKYFRPGVN